MDHLILVGEILKINDVLSRGSFVIMQEDFGTGLPVWVEKLGCFVGLPLLIGIIIWGLVYKPEGWDDDTPKNP
jgi:hypothetical protein